MELIRRAIVNGYQAIAITDHAGPGEMERFITEISRDCALAEKHWNIKAIPGVELTHLPPASIPEIARQAKEMGAKLVVVHGETTAEPVESGTNIAAVKSSYIDILSHPGKLTDREASIARENGVFIELSARKGHSLTNQHVAAIARDAGAHLLLNSDAHGEDDLLTAEIIAEIFGNISLTEDEMKAILKTNPGILLNRI